MKNSVLTWLEKTAQKMPDKIAVHDEKGEITYHEYRDKSQAIACEIVQIH